MATTCFQEGATFSCLILKAHPRLKFNVLNKNTRDIIRALFMKPLQSTIWSRPSAARVTMILHSSHLRLIFMLFVSHVPMKQAAERIILNEEVTFLLLPKRAIPHYILPFAAFHNSRPLRNPSDISRDASATFGEGNNNAAIIQLPSIRAKRLSAGP